MKIIICGDFVPNNRIAAQIEKGNYECLDSIKSIIHESDYSIVNFESPIVINDAAPISKTGPNLSCSKKGMECISQAGFKCVTLANNHFRDYGQQGVEDTIMMCKKYGIDYVGGGVNLDEAKRILYKNINGQKLAIINVCENEWSIATEDHGGAAPLDVISVFYAIKEAKKSSDYVLVIVHSGIELFQFPTPRMVKTYRFFIDAGADAVINHHQHCYNGYEIHNNKPIFYGLGNLCFDKMDFAKTDLRINKLWEEGFFVELVFDKNITFNLYPYIQCTKDEAFVRLLDDKEQFEKSLIEMCSVISDNTEIRQRFEQRAAHNMETTRGLFVPYSNRIVKKLAKMKMLPSYITRNRIKTLLAHIQCESHRDILICELKDLLYKN